MRYTTLLFVPLLTVTGLSAQDYLADGPLWRVRSLCGVPAPCIATDNYLYFTAGDSVIEGVTYTKVLRQGSVTYNWQASPPPLSNCSGTTNYGPDYDVPQLVRQVDRQLRIWDGTADVLLHEFDLVVGSTLPQSWTNWNEDITVSAVDSVLVGTEMRARYALQNSWAPYLIEGIGSSHGLFEPISNFFDCGYELECFGLGAESYYPVAGEGCGLPMGVADHATLEDHWTMAPNPASGPVRILAMDPVQGPVVVRDAQGRVVQRANVSGMTTVDLDVAGMSNGVYSVQVGGGTLQRLVVSH